MITNPGSPWKNCPFWLAKTRTGSEQCQATEFEAIVEDNTGFILNQFKTWHQCRKIDCLLVQIYWKADRDRLQEESLMDKEGHITRCKAADCFYNHSCGDLQFCHICDYVGVEKRGAPYNDELYVTREVVIDENHKCLTYEPKKRR